MLKKGYKLNVSLIQAEDIQDQINQPAQAHVQRAATPSTLVSVISLYHL